MVMHSRRRIRIRGVVVDAVTSEFLLPEGTFERMAVVVIGATNFGRAGQFESLAWPPQLVLAEYGPEFLKTTGSLDYAKSLELRGHVTRVYVMKTIRDHEIAIQQMRELRGVLVTKFRRWLQQESHPKDQTWVNQVSHLSRAIDAFGAQRLTLEDLIHRFIQAFASLGSHHQQRGMRLIQEVWALSAKYDRRLAVRFSVAYLLRNVQGVTYFLYGDARDQLVDSVEIDPTQSSDDPVYLQHLFDQVKRQQAQFKADQIPFYQPEWIKKQREANRPVWPLSQLLAYEKGGL